MHKKWQQKLPMKFQRCGLYGILTGLVTACMLHSPWPESFVNHSEHTGWSSYLDKRYYTLWSCFPWMHLFDVFIYSFKGMVPALFLDDEKESVLGQIRDEAMKMGAGPSKESVWQYFVNKSANNLHIVLGMSPVGETLRTRCRNFPGTGRSTLFYPFCYR